MSAPPAEWAAPVELPSADDLPRILRLGGRKALLRRLRPADADALRAFFASHTLETIWRRYGYFATQMTPEHAARLVGVDQARDAALGVFEETESGGSRLIAIGRYCLAEAEGFAELAFVVHEQRRQLGIAGLLLHTLIAIARARGVPRLVAFIQHDNVPMLAAFRRVDAELHSIGGEAGIEATIRLAASR